MSSRQRSLRLLVKVRARRVNALEEAVKQAVVAHKQAIDVEESARGEVQNAVEEEHAGVEELKQATSAGQRFDVNDFLYRQDHVETLKGNVVTCQSTLENKTELTSAAKHQIRDRRLAVTRHEQKTQSLKDQILKIQNAAQLEADDQQDEESEEVAISRFIQASRAQAARDAK